MKWTGPLHRKTPEQRPGGQLYRGGIERSLEPEDRLIQQCVRGDLSAWETLVRQYSRRVFPICFRFTGNDTDAQDLTQEVFLRVYKSLKTYRPGEGAFVVWLTRLTRNLLIDHYRKGKMDRATDSMEQQMFQVERQSPSTLPADARLERREARELLQDALSKMSPELREAIILRDLEQLDYREVAQALGIPEGTVKSRLNRGRAELARLLRKQGVTR